MAKKQSRAQGMTLQIIGAILIIIGMGIFIFSKDYGMIVAFVGGAIAFIIFSTGMNLYKSGKRHFTISVEQALRENPRRPVIYLRSFFDDKIASRSIQDPILPMIENDFVKTDEEALAEIMQEVGPFIAIGKPGEELPELGAARMYVGDNEWQDVITGLMRRARLVVMRAGKTAGFIWEFQQVVKLVNPNKIILLIPMDEENYLEFCEAANQYLPKPLPKYNGKFLGIVGFSQQSSLTGVIYFDIDWSSHFISWDFPLLKNRKTSYGTSGFQTIFHAIFDIKRIHYAPKKPNPVQRTIFYILLGVLALSIICSISLVFPL